jgi:hypothetical protein
MKFELGGKSYDPGAWIVPFKVPSPKELMKALYDFVADITVDTRMGFI